MGNYDLDSLAVAAKNDSKVFRKLLEASRCNIEREVKKYARGINNNFADEYMSEAISALYKSVLNFNSDKGNFSAYSSSCMKQAILDFMREKQSTISIGTTKISEINKLNYARKIIRENGLDETKDNLMKYSGINSKKTLETVLLAERSNGTISIDSNIDKDSDTTILDFKSDDFSIEEEVLKNEQIRSLYISISNLSNDEQYLIIYSYGLLGKDKKSNKEMALYLKVSENTIVNRKNAIKDKLRVMMEPLVA